MTQQTMINRQYKAKYCSVMEFDDTIWSQPMIASVKTHLKKQPGQVFVSVAQSLLVLLSLCACQVMIGILQADLGRIQHKAKVRAVRQNRTAGMQRHSVIIKTKNKKKKKKRKRRGGQRGGGRTGGGRRVPC